MKNILYIALTSIWLFAGCYSDKGNYDYIKLNEIEIGGIDYNTYYYLYLGETFMMPEPEIIFVNSEGAHDDLSYRWRIDNKVVSDKKILSVDIALPLSFSYYVGDFTVTDNKTGVSYLQKFRVSVTSNFAMGWMWFAERNGKTELDMFTSNNKYYGNLIKTVNETELGQGYRMVEHFSQVGYNWYSSMLIVAGQNSMELNISSLRSEVKLSQEFTSASLPEGFNPVAAAFTKTFSCVVGDNGKVHVRHSPGGYLYEGRYPSIPFYSSFHVSPITAQANPPAFNVAVFFDETSCSYLYLDGDGAIQRLDNIADSGGAFAVANMDKELIYIAPVAQSGTNSTFYAILLDRSTGKYMSQQFVFGLSGKEAYLHTIAEVEFPDEVNAETKFAVGYKKTDVWYTKGSKLYKYNRELNDTPMMVKDFKTGNIQGLALNVYADQYGIVVANGTGFDFFLETIGGVTIQSQTDINGKVSQLIYKVGYGFYF